MNKYIPSTSKWVREQVKLYEASGGTKGTTMNGLPVIIVTNIGWKTKAIRKTPLMKVTHGKKYILVASNGGSESHPSWYKNIKLEPKIKIQDGTDIYNLEAMEVIEKNEKITLWEIAEKIFPQYKEYQQNTKRNIPIFITK